MSTCIWYNLFLMNFSEDYEYAVVCKISAYMQFSGSLMNHVLCMLFCDCFQIWILSICNGNQKGTSEMSNWFVGIMTGSLIPLNCVKYNTKKVSTVTSLNLPLICFCVIKYPSPYLNSSRKWKNLTVLCSANVEVCKMLSSSY